MNEIIAHHVTDDLMLDAGRPTGAWKQVPPISFCLDWSGSNPHPDLLTDVQALWSPRSLFLRFECHYRDLWFFEDSEPNGRRDRLWERDVVEAFLQPNPASLHTYKEFEVSPNGMWIDLEISDGGLADLKSGIQRSVAVDEVNRVWSAEVSIPWKALTNDFDPKSIWRANFYRVEGREEPRKYLAWQPTRTAQPNFHVPECFGMLKFGE